MRITKEDIGKKVACPGVTYPMTILAVGVDLCICSWTSDSGSRMEQSFSVERNFRFLEEPRDIQKPSERITELCIQDELESNPKSFPYFKQIVDYLDEVLPPLLEKR